jgi:putative heme iron utilization protein
MMCEKYGKKPKAYQYHLCGKCLEENEKMKTKSCKAKGRRLQNMVADALNGKKGYACRPAIMGESGADIKWLVEFAPKMSIECKNQESWNVPEFWKQAAANAKDDKPVLVLKKNNHEALVVMRFEDWMELI